MAEFLLDVRDLHAGYGRAEVLHGLNLRARPGEVITVIGPNGAGKSTLLNALMAALPARGTVAYDGKVVDLLSLEERVMLGMALVPETRALFATMTVLENVALGAHLRGRHGIPAAMLRLDRAEERRLMREAERQLRRIGMAELMHEQAGNLALGQQRLMEIARALAADPILLLLDEPAAGLRLKEKEGLAGVLRQLRSEGLSILLVEHDMDLVMGLVDRVVVMEFGTKLIEGTPEEVQASPAVRAAYLGTEH